MLAWYQGVDRKGRKMDAGQDTASTGGYFMVILQMSKLRLRE